MFRNDFTGFVSDMEKLSGSLAVLAKIPVKRPKFGISPLRKFENVYLLAEDFSFFPCLYFDDKNGSYLFIYL